MRLFALALAIGCAAGCKRPPPPPAPPARLVEVAIADRTPEEDRPAPVDTESLKQRLLDAWQKAGALPLAIGSAPHPGVDYKLRLDVRLEGAEVEERGVMRAYLEARLTRVAGALDEAPIVNQAVAEKIYQRKELPVGGRPAAFRAHLERAVADVTRALAGQVKLHVGDDAALVAALRSGEPELRLEAAGVAADRKSAAAVPPLIELLKGDDAKLRDRALGALVAIGDRRAVKPITEAARFRELAELPKVIDALATLGGDEARAWLEFVASGHEDPEVRELSKEALSRLDRRSLDHPPDAR